jgi:hypothetical protein
MDLPDTLLFSEEDATGVSERAPPAYYNTDRTNLFMNYKGSDNPWKNMHQARFREGKMPASLMDGARVRAMSRHCICPYWASGRGCSRLIPRNGADRTCELLRPTMVNGMNVIDVNICRDRGRGRTHVLRVCKRMHDWNDTVQKNTLTENDIIVDFGIAISAIDG